jgi:hypothetical protein
MAEVFFSKSFATTTIPMVFGYIFSASKFICELGSSVFAFFVLLSCFLQTRVLVFQNRIISFNSAFCA